MTVETCFQQVLKRTEALLDLIDQAARKATVAEEIDHLLEEREQQLQVLREKLLQVPNPRVYELHYQQLQQLEERVAQHMEQAMADLKQKIHHAQQNRNTGSQYDSYYREGPYGVFIDKKK
jgi:exonuclease VII large subunit